MAPMAAEEDHETGSVMVKEDVNERPIISHTLTGTVMMGRHTAPIIPSG